MNNGFQPALLESGGGILTCWPGVSESRRIPGEGSFTLVEVLVAMGIFAISFTGLFLAYGQSVRMLDGLRQLSRSEDIALANIEFLRTRSWPVLTNLVTTSSSSTYSQYSSNMTESINAQVTYNSVANSAVCTHLELLSGDPLRIGIKNIRRDIAYSPWPLTPTTSLIRATVTVSWDVMRSNQSAGTVRLTNSMVTFITKGGLSADVF